MHARELGPGDGHHLAGGVELHRARAQRDHACLLYTSDAADERSSVDLGGRRIIKKKTIRGARVRRSSSRIRYST